MREDFIVNKKEKIARGIWKSLEQREVDWTRPELSARERSWGEEWREKKRGVGARVAGL